MLRGATRLRLGLATMALAALVAVAGCSGKEAFTPQLEPDTFFFIDGVVDTVYHQVHLFWYGTDPDGQIEFYEFRMLDPAAAADSAWRRTTRTDSLFSVLTPAGYAEPTFQVRAVDDDGLRDPSPVSQVLRVRNLAPLVTLSFYPVANDTTFASLTLSWTGLDPDGDANQLRYRVWVDGNEASSELVEATTYTVPTAAFLDGGAIRSGTRTIFVQAVDPGGFAGPVVSRSWQVRPATAGGAEARLLIIDDVNSSLGPINVRTDSLWQNAAARNLPAGTWTVLRLESAQPFRSPKDVEQTFALFDAVIWYRSTVTAFSPLLRDMQGGIGAAIEAGTTVLLEGNNLVDGLSSLGPLSPAFVSEYFQTDYLYKHFSSGMPDSSVIWGAGTGSIFTSGAAISDEALRTQSILNGIRGFAVRDTDHVLLWARAGELSQNNEFDIPIALAVPHSSGAKAVIITVPVVTSSAPPATQRATAFLNKVYNEVLEIGSSAPRARRASLENRRQSTARRRAYAP